MTDIYPKRLDWRRILQDIKDAEYSIYEVAKRMGKSESTVQSWYRGHEPSHSNGAALLEFHTYACGEDATKKRCTEIVVYEESK